MTRVYIRSAVVQSLRQIFNTTVYDTFKARQLGTYDRIAAVPVPHQRGLKGSYQNVCTTTSVAYTRTFDYAHRPFTAACL